MLRIPSASIGPFLAAKAVLVDRRGPVLPTAVQGRVILYCLLSDGSLPHPLVACDGALLRRSTSLSPIEHRYSSNLSPELNYSCI